MATGLLTASKAEGMASSSSAWRPKVFGELGPNPYTDQAHFRLRGGSGDANADADGINEPDIINIFLRLWTGKVRAFTNRLLISNVQRFSFVSRSTLVILARCKDIDRI